MECRSWQIDSEEKEGLAALTGKLFFERRDPILRASVNWLIQPSFWWMLNTRLVSKMKWR
jgi:hypothetical protein